MSNSLVQNRNASGPPSNKAANLVRVEANFLRLPLFALSTKDLSKRTGIRCQGEFRRGENTYQFDFKATRNSDTHFPGPMSRKLHFALLDILTEQVMPFQNPVRWTWGDLCRRIGIRKSGRTVEQLKEAIRATAGLMIWSQKAIFVKSDNEALVTNEKGQTLYQSVEFATDRSAGGVRDANELWLADWYLDNLNSLYSCPLNFDLWIALDAVSPMASRLYELLYYRFCRDVETLQFNYRTLVNLLPVAEERYRSSAEKQFHAAFDHLVKAGVIASAEWTDSKTEGEVGKVLFRRGPLLNLAGADQPVEDETDRIAFDTIRVETLTGRGSDEEDVVADFYREWLGHEDRRPTKDELAYAREILAEHGKTKARALIPMITGLLRRKWPEAKSFGAVKMYLSEALSEYRRAEDRRSALETERTKRRDEREQERLRKVENELLVQQWQALSEAERERIRKAVIATHRGVEQLPAFLEQMCLFEMKNRRAA